MSKREHVIRLRPGRIRDKGPSGQKAKSFVGQVMRRTESGVNGLSFWIIWLTRPQIDLWPRSVCPCRPRSIAHTASRRHQSAYRTPSRSDIPYGSAGQTPRLSQA